MADEIYDDASGHTTDRMSSRQASGCGPVQIVGRLSGRRRWTVEQKLMIIGEAFSPGSPQAAVLERHEIGSGQLYTWRRQLLDGELGGQRAGIGVLGPMAQASPAFARVEIAPSCVPALSHGAPVDAVAGTGLASIIADDQKAVAGRRGVIEIELRSGIRVRVEGLVEAEALGCVLDVLERR